MKRTTLSNHLDAFKTEGLMILRFQLAYDRISKFKNLDKIGRSDFVDNLIALKAIENDLVIRICKFDDNTKGVHSFKKVLNEIPITHVNRNIIVDKVQNFSKLISYLKRERRHTQLAHLRIGHVDGEYEIKYNLKPIIKSIIEIINLINVTKLSYNWTDGSYEEFDLIKEVLLND